MSLIDTNKAFDMPICEVCGKHKSVGVASVPGVPYSAAFCKECLEANAYPWHILVAATAVAATNLDSMAPWWIQMVDDTCKHLGKTRKQFDEDLERNIREIDELGKRYDNE